MSNGLTLPFKQSIADIKEAAFQVENTGGNVAVEGSIAGVMPVTVNAVGVQGVAAPQTVAIGSGVAITVGVQGINNTTAQGVVVPPNLFVISAIGVEGVSKASAGGAQGGGVRVDPIGVHGSSDNGDGVKGDSTNGFGVEGVSTNANGVAGSSVQVAGIRGISINQEGVRGESNSATFSAVAGIQLNPNTTGPGVWGESHRIGVIGHLPGDGPREATPGAPAGVWGRGGPTGDGVFGSSIDHDGVVGDSVNGDGVYGRSHNLKRAGISGHNDPGGLAGFFEGQITVTEGISVGQDVTVGGSVFVNGDVLISNKSDCAEEFDVCPESVIDPGTVMVLDEDGSVRPSARAYDKRVAGVVSGAGDYQPGIVLGKQSSQGHRAPIALVGRVYCKADAQYGAIQIGDLLTTSPRVGHAMKARQPGRAFGAVIGKALRPLATGQDLIPILIALQ